MSQFFNLTRFGRLLRKHFAEHLASYGLSTSVLLGGSLALLGFISYVSGGLSQSAQGVMYLLGLLAGGAFFTSTVLAEYGQGSRAAMALTLPASPFEKFLMAWLVSVPGFLVVYTAVFYLADWLVLTLSGHAKMLATPFDAPESVARMLAYFLLLHAVALWGSIAFRKQQFIRTGFVLFALVAGLGLANFQALRALLGTRPDMALPLGTVHLADGLRLSLPDSQERWLAWLPVVLVLLLWPAAYARFTEKQL